MTPRTLELWCMGGMDWLSGIWAGEIYFGLPGSAADRLESWSHRTEAVWEKGFRIFPLRNGSREYSLFEQLQKKTDLIVSSYPYKGGTDHIL